MRRIISILKKINILDELNIKIDEMSRRVLL